MKRALDAHTTTLQALADMLLEEFTKKHTTPSDNLSSVVEVVHTSSARFDGEKVRHAHVKVIRSMEESSFIKRLEADV